MVFQDYALFPHLTVARQRGLRLAAAERRPGARARRRDARPRRHGRRRATATRTSSRAASSSASRSRARSRRGRSCCCSTSLSPTSTSTCASAWALEVREILKQQNTTAILVTHDQHDAFAIADEIGIMRDRRIEQWESAVQALSPPCDALRRGLRRTGRVSHGLGARRRPHRHRAGRLPCKRSPTPGPRDTTVDVLLRPDDILHDDASPLQAEVLHKAFRGAEFLYTLRLPLGGRVCRSCPATTTTRSARRSASAWRSSTSWHFQGRSQRSRRSTDAET